MKLLSKKQVENLRKFTEIQGTSGNWDYDEYMHGMYNGMEFMLAIVEKREPVFKDAPDEFLVDKPIPNDPPEQSE